MAILLFSGRLGGAETFCAHLAAHLPRYGVDGHVVLIERAGELPKRLQDLNVPYTVYGAKRGRDIVYNAQRFARLINRHGRDAAILGWPGYVAATLRLGGYRGTVVAVEHGALLAEDRRGRLRRIYKGIDWRMGVWAVDQHVAVSRFALARLERAAHRGQPMLVYNGVDLAAFRPPDRPGRNRGPVVIGAASRLIAGKGIDVLLRAMVVLRSQVNVRLLIAGDGPEGTLLRRLSTQLGLDEDVAFTGSTNDVPGFWARCDIAVMPSDTWIETFGLSALESMACCLPVVATRNGGLSEVVEDGVTGLIVPPGDHDALAVALEHYASDREARVKHGTAGRARAERHFDVRQAARAYANLITAHSGVE